MGACWAPDLQVHDLPQLCSMCNVACSEPCNEGCAVRCLQYMHMAQSAAHARMLLQGGGTVNDPGAMMRTREWGCLVSGCRDQETSADACPSGDKSQVHSTACEHMAGVDSDRRVSPQGCLPRFSVSQRVARRSMFPVTLCQDAPWSLAQCHISGCPESPSSSGLPTSTQTEVGTLSDIRCRARRHSEH